MNKEPKIPGWMKDLPNNATIGNREICEIYGLHRGSLNRCIELGLLAQAPAFQPERPCGEVKYRWRLGDIRKHVRMVTSND